jgi:hypothetical protein
VAEPLVSVCLPTFNGAEHLSACLERVLAQTVNDLEILVVDDASTDRTHEIAAAAALADPRVRVERNRSNLGLVPNWNRCLALARGQWVKFVFQDDLLELDCVDHLLRAARPDRPLVAGTRVFRFDDVDEAVRADYDLASEHHLQRVFGPVSWVGPGDFCRVAIEHFGVNVVGEPSSTLVHRAMFERFGAFNPHLVALCDFEFWARVAATHGLAVVAETVATFRVHRGAASEVNRGSQRFRREMLDPLVLLWEFATAPAYAPMRTTADSQRPPVDLRHRAVMTAVRARRAAERALLAEAPDHRPLDAWRAVVAAYPAIARLRQVRRAEVECLATRYNQRWRNWRAQRHVLPG